MDDTHSRLSLVCSQKNDIAIYPSQEVDLVRLGYDEDKLQSEQLEITVTSDGKLIAILFKDRTIKIFDVHSNKFIKTIKVPTDKMTEKGIQNLKMDLTITNDDKIIIINDDDMMVLNWKSGALLKTFKLDNSCGKASIATAYRAKQNILAVSSICGITTIWDLNSLELIVSIENKVRRGGIAAVALSRDAKRVFVNADRMRLHELPSGRIIKEYESSSPLMAFFDEQEESLYIGGLVQGMSLANSKCYIDVLDANNLSLNIKDFATTKYGDGAPFAGISYKEKLLVSLHTRRRCDPAGDGQAA